MTVPCSREWLPGLVHELDEFPRPFLAVDVALLTVLAGPGGAPQLHVLLVDVEGPRARGRALPGVMVQETETLQKAAQRAIAAKAQLKRVARRRPQQLELVDAVRRDPRGRVVTVAHAELVPASQLEARAATATLVPVEKATGLAYDHDHLVRLARSWAGEQYDGPAPDPSGLLEHPFSVSELRDVHAAVSGEELHTTTILKRYGSQLERAGRRSSGRGRPHELFVVKR